MKNFLLIILSIIALNGFAQKEFYKGHNYYVWAYKGLNLRETAEIDSKVLTVIPYGAIVTIDSLVDMKDMEVEIINSIVISDRRTTNCGLKEKTPNCVIKGKMVKVVFNGLAGFVFNGFLSELEPIYENHNIFNLGNAFETNYGVLAKLDKSAKEDYDCNSQIIYKNGFVAYHNCGIGWWQRTFVIKDISFQEGLLVFANFIKKNNSGSIDYKWFIIKKEDYFISFSEESEMYDASLEQLGNLMVISISGSN
jgi:hypothetical protein